MRAAVGWPRCVRTAAVVAVAALTASLPFTLAVAPAGADSASKLWSEFEAASARHAQSAEALAKIDGQLADLDREVQANTSTLTGLRVEVGQLAVRLYVHATTTDPLAALTDPNEGAAASGLLQGAFGLSTDAVDRYRAAAQDLAERRAQATAMQAEREAVDRQLAGEEAVVRARAVKALADERAIALARAAAQAKAKAEAAARQAAAAAAARQATARAKAGANRPAAALVSVSAVGPGDPTDAQLLQIRMCESGGNYASRSNPVYRGAYQFLRTTWDRIALIVGRPDLVGVDPADAATADQDLLARELFRQAGPAPWGVCGARVHA